MESVLDAVYLFLDLIVQMEFKLEISLKTALESDEEARGRTQGEDMEGSTNFSILIFSISPHYPLCISILISPL